MLLVVYFFCFDVQRTAYQLNKCHWGIVASTEATLQNTKVTTRTLIVTGAKLIKQLGYRCVVAQAGKRQTTIRYRIYFGERDQRLRYTTKLFGFRQRCFNQLMTNQ